MYTSKYHAVFCKDIKILYSPPQNNTPQKWQRRKDTSQKVYIIHSHKSTKNNDIVIFSILSKLGQ